MLATLHWSASAPVRLRAYHVEFARVGTLTPELLHDLRAIDGQANAFASVPWDQLRSLFTIWKNDELTTETDYGTWDMNTDPRDGSPNVEIAAMCMAGATTTDFGSEPYTIAHAWMHAAILARVCALKNLDSHGGFLADVEPSTLQNGPIYVCSTHGERAIQTVNWGVEDAGASSQAASTQFGYFLGSGDPSSRWDCTIRDPEWISSGATVQTCKASAGWYRDQAHAIKAAGISDFWGIDGPDTP